MGLNERILTFGGIMKVKTMIRYSQVTPKHVYLNRRQILAGGLAALALPGIAQGGTKLQGVTKSKYTVEEKVTPYDAITKYNNFYEFGTSKEQPAELAKDFRTNPWSLSIEGAVAKPQTLDLDAIM